MTTESQTSENKVHQCMVANTIREQLGGTQFTLMTGANTWVYGATAEGNPFLRFNIGSNAKHVSKVQITFDEGLDLYNIVFLRRLKHDYKEVAKYEGVYVDHLTDIFTTETGLHTRLMPRR